MTGHRATPLALALLLLAGCGGGGSSGQKAPAAAPAATATTPAPTPTPTPSPTLPPVAADTAALRKALITSAELGAPWLTPKTVATAGHNSGELCPGHLAAEARVKPRATVNTAMTAGSKAGAAIGSFVLEAYDPTRLDAYAAAYPVAYRSCAAYISAEKLYVTSEALPDPGVPGAESTQGYLQRIYTDKSRARLLYVRQDYAARVGRVLVVVEHAFIQPAADPTGKDVSGTTRLLAKQVAKVQTSFPG